MNRSTRTTIRWRLRHSSPWYGVFSRDRHIITRHGVLHSCRRITAREHTKLCGGGLSNRARKRKREREGRCEGRKPLSETKPEVVALARKLRRRRPKGGQLS